MTPAVPQGSILPGDLPAALSCLLAAAGLAAWVGSHLVGRKPGSRPARAGLAALRLGIGTVALAATAGALGHWIALTTNWPLWLPPLAGACAVEAALALYSLERQTVPSRAGAALPAMRVGLALLVVAMLAQPVFRAEHVRHVRRCVAVLADRSASMQVADGQLGVSERMRIAELLRPGLLSRPHRLETAARELESVRRELAEQAEWLSMLDELDAEAQQRHLRSRSDRLRAALEEAGRAVERRTQALGELAGDDAELTGELIEALTTAGDRLRDVAGLLTGEGPAHETPAAPLVEGLKGALPGLDASTPRLHDLGVRLDEAYYDVLSEEQRAAVDAVGEWTRRELADHVLRGADAGEAQGGPSFGGLLSR
ncbi:MAG: hypothetical protein AMK73_09645 [Planctomycetes bacterium SM23_32]|nr:MAG: hypothetical protein AMK73_09645 [Planctomycetes bacterium SM23_32]